MAGLPVRRGGGGGAGAGGGGEVDPFGMVRDSMRRMQNLFRDPLFEIDPIGYLEAGGMTSFAPDFEVRETQDGLVFTADVPGVKEDDLDVTVVGNRLRINGKREFQQENRGDTWYTAERSYGSFTRSFILPEGCDTNNVNANLENGVLTIHLGKRAESQPRRISLGGQQQRAIEGQYSQGPFQQSQQEGQKQPVTQQAGSQQQARAQPPGTSGYGQAYTGSGPVPEARREGYGAAAAGEEAGERPQAGAERTFGAQGGEPGTPKSGKPDKG